MNGYLIRFNDVSGKPTFSFFGEPITSPGFHFGRNSADDKLDLVLYFFFQEYPDCQVISAEKITYDEYNKMIGE